MFTLPWAGGTTNAGAGNIGAGETCASEAEAYADDTSCCGDLVCGDLKTCKSTSIHVEGGGGGSGDVVGEAGGEREMDKAPLVLMSWADNENVVGFTNPSTLYLEVRADVLTEDDVVSQVSSLQDAHLVARGEL
jgi:hypothetical protein